MSKIIEGITAFMSEDLGIDNSGIVVNSPLFSSGIIDSFSLVSLLSYIEDTYQIRISSADVNLDNFDSLERILAYIQSKLE
ncbi:MAG: acyl carrier protein [Pirellulales bacterium]